MIKKIQLIARKILGRKWRESQTLALMSHRKVYSGHRPMLIHYNPREFFQSHLFHSQFNHRISNNFESLKVWEITDNIWKTEKLLGFFENQLKTFDSHIV